MKWPQKTLHHSHMHILIMQIPVLIARNQTRTEKCSTVNDTILTETMVLGIDRVKITFENLKKYLKSHEICRKDLCLQSDFQNSPFLLKSN